MTNETRTRLDVLLGPALEELNDDSSFEAQDLFDYLKSNGWFDGVVVRL